MHEYYIFLVVVLFILAISDLMVGVSNDAVNFLNSAIGSRVAPRHIIMIVASIGIVVGATFSSGMMEVARKGIFVPENFLFAEIMVVFLAVMITDIILLDLFNTFGLPTSTTVSIVFELLGASVAVALLKMANSEVLGLSLADFINWSNAIEIVSGIFLSVIIAFSVGLAVQYFSRLLLSFEYSNRMRHVGILWAGASITAIAYFLMIKGLKNASFVGPETYAWVMDNSVLLLAASFVFWSLLAGVLIRAFKINVLRPIVLFGTFALAMAFAGNDLVNFIGVPIAGLQSFEFWSESGLAADQMSMAALAEKIPTPTLMLIGAGLIMVVTLWLSRKARTVTETEVNLGRQDEGAERFSPNGVARVLVRGSMGVGRLFRSVVPNSALAAIERNFRVAQDDKQDGTAFDLVRASVNLTVASILISIATSMKLPLSTTYVSFMVAMGASLADRAWGRDSAIYRVSGVLSVISGWFMTAIIAFSAAALFAFVIYTFEFWGVIFLLLVLVSLVTRTILFHRGKEKAKEARNKYFSRSFSDPQELRRTNIAGAVATLNAVQQAVKNAIEGLNAENRKQLDAARAEIEKVSQKNESHLAAIPRSIRGIEGDDMVASRFHMIVYDLERDLAGSTQELIRECYVHVANVHAPLDAAQQKSLNLLFSDFEQYFEPIVKSLSEENVSNQSFAAIMQNKSALIESIETQLSQLARGIRSGDYSARNSKLLLGILLQLKDIVALGARFVKVFHRSENNPAKPLLVSASAESNRPAGL